MHASLICSHWPGHHQPLCFRHTPSHYVLHEQETQMDSSEILVRVVCHGGQLSTQEPNKRVACLWVRGSLATRKGKCSDGSLRRRMGDGPFFGKPLDGHLYLVWLRGTSA